MKLSGNIQRHSPVRVNAFAVEVPFSREPKLEPNQPEQLLKEWLTCSSASSVCNVGKDEILFCNGFAD